MMGSLQRTGQFDGSDQLMIRAREVCELTGLSRTTLHRLVEAKEFPQPVRLTQRTVMFYRNDVDDWLHRLRDRQGEPAPKLPPAKTKSPRRPQRRAR